MLISEIERRRQAIKTLQTQKAACYLMTNIPDYERFTLLETYDTMIAIYSASINDIDLGFLILPSKTITGITT